MKAKFILLLFFIPATIFAQSTIFSSEEIWKYYDLEETPMENWTANTYNDAAWVSGNTQMGYGDGDENTLINNNSLTCYFRKTFQVTNLQSTFNYLIMEAIRDDGMIVYLNDTEVWRSNMPEGNVDYNTFATLNANPENGWVKETIANNLLVGTNTLAVEIHQRNSSSTDLSFDFRLQVSDQVTTKLKRGPYLQKGSATNTTIKYRTNIETQTIINYGTTLGALNNTVSNTTSTKNHEIELTGLVPNTKYYYEIADNNGVFVSENNEMYIKTAPEIGTDQFVRAWILGDAGTINNNQRNVRDQYYNYVLNTTTNPNQTDMLLFLGDNAYSDGHDSQYQAALFNIYNEQLKKTVAWSTLGNHDGHTADSNSQTGPYYDIFNFPTAAEVGGVASGTEAYYSFDYANIHFIVLESYTLHNDATQIAWCTQDIQNTTQDWIIALFHHPAYTKGSHDSDTETPLINMRNNFLPILENNGVDLVLSGHSHSYERSYFINGHYGASDTFNVSNNIVGANGNLSGQADTPDGAYNKTEVQNDGTVYITTGSAGKVSDGDLNHNAMYFSLKQLGSCVLEIESDGGTGQNLTVKFITDTGVVDDYFTINKSNLTLSTNENSISKNKPNVYPVPAKSILNIEISKQETLINILIYDAIGKLIKTSTNNKINVGSLKSGLFIIQIKTDKGEYFKNIIID